MENIKSKEKAFEFLLFSNTEKLYELKEEIIEEVLNRISNFNQDEALLTSKQVCNTYNISQSTLERYIRKGLKFKNSGNKTKRMFLKSEIEKFFDNNILKIRRR